MAMIQQVRLKVSLEMVQEVFGAMGFGESFEKGGFQFWESNERSEEMREFQWVYVEKERELKGQ